MPKLIAVTIGDLNGVGIKILLNCWKTKKVKKFVLFTDANILKDYLKKNNYRIKINIIKEDIDYVNNKLNIFSYKSHSLEDNTYKSLLFAYDFCVKKKCIGIITLPIRKDLIINSIDERFIGQTELFQKLDKKKYANMILFHKKTIISPITTHIEINKISKYISKKNFLFNQIINLFKTLKNDFNINNPKIIISGLNPHAGENGKIGNEETKLISPVINKIKNKGFNIDGPVSPDTMLINKNLKKYNCFIFMYHDQALIPFKYISQFSGVNYTGNLDIIRTSPDHGTAYHLVNKKQISYESFINCFRLVKKIFKNRTLND